MYINIYNKKVIVFFREWVYIFIYFVIEFVREWVWVCFCVDTRNGCDMVRGTEGASLFESDLKLRFKFLVEMVFFIKVGFDISAKK